MSDDLVSRAKALACRAHEGQVDKAGRPYIEHVARVAAAVADDPVAEAVAWLHDVLEDQPEFYDEAFSVLPRKLFGFVLALSRNQYSRDERDDYYSTIRKFPLALRVKLADIADNSSEERLALLDEKTAARLRRKYAKAIEALAGGK